MYMIWVVLDKPELLDNIQHAWEKVGIQGATFIESSGFFRRKQKARYVPTRYVLPSLSDTGHKNNYSIFSIVKDEEQAQAALKATEEITGDLDLPNTGVFAAWPLAIVKGISPGKFEGECQ